MKEKLISILFFVLLFAIVFSGCFEEDNSYSDVKKQLNIMTKNSNGKEILIVYEGDFFIVKVTDENQNPIKDAVINFDLNIYYTDSKGEAIIIAPLIVTHNMSFSIEVSYKDYETATETIHIINKTQLSIELESNNVGAGTDFLVIIKDEFGERKVGVNVKLDEVVTYITDIYGEVNFIAPSEVGKYSITASCFNCINATSTITVT